MASAMNQPGSGGVVKSVRLHWKRYSLALAATDGSLYALYTTGPYVLISHAGSQPASADYTVINTQTGQTSEVPAPPVPGCMFPLAGLAGTSSTLYSSCSTATSSQIELFSLASQTWSPMPVSPQLASELSACADTMNNGCSVSAVVLGANWVGYATRCGGLQCSTPHPSPPGYNNLTTGAWVPATSRAVVNPNSSSSTPITSPCKPVVAPPGSVLTYHGPIVVVKPQSNGIGFAEKCGSTSRMTVEAAVSSSPTITLGAGRRTSLTGMLASGQRFDAHFALPVSPGFEPAYWFGVTGNTLWAESNSEIWTASANPLNR